MNQHASPRRAILACLAESRRALDAAAVYRAVDLAGRAAVAVRAAQFWLGRARAQINAAPASTRRRWKSGR